MKQAETAIEASTAKVAARGKKGLSLGQILAREVGGAIIKKQLRASKERLELERDAISSISVDLGLDLLTGTVTRAPVDHAMTI